MKIPTVAEKLNIRWASLTGVVLSSSRFGLEYDRVKVLQEIGLEQPLAADEHFYIPPAGRPFDVRKVFPDGNITNFAGQRFKDLQDELGQYQDALKSGNVEKMNELHELFVATTMLTPVLYNKGTHVLTFEYELAIYPTDNIFEVSLWAPMPSFQPVGQSQITASIQLPSESNFSVAKAKIIEAQGYQPDAQGNPTQVISKVLDTSYGLRHIVAWNWQNDPLFKVRYQYIG